MTDENYRTWVEQKNKGERQIRVYTERGYCVVRATYRDPYSHKKYVHEFTPVTEENYRDYLELLIEHRQYRVDAALYEVERAKKALEELM